MPKSDAGRVAGNGLGNGRPPPENRAPKAAFDVWLERGLHEMFDDIANEPIPEDLLRLINDDRPK